MPHLILDLNIKTNEFKVIVLIDTNLRHIICANLDKEKCIFEENNLPCSHPYLEENGKALIISPISYNHE